MTPNPRDMDRRVAPQGARGMTLIELMVSLAVLAIVVALAAPDFSQMGRSTRVQTLGADLQNALAYARTESLRRGVRVTLCRSATPQATAPACSGAGDWASGWLVFLDNVQVAGNVAGTLDGTDTLLRIGDALPGVAVTVTGNLGGWVTYSPQGLIRTSGGAADGSFRVCKAPEGRRVTLTGAGMATVVAESC